MAMDTKMTASVADAQPFTINTGASSVTINFEHADQIEWLQNRVISLTGQVNELKMSSMAKDLRLQQMDKQLATLPELELRIAKLEASNKFGSKATVAGLNMRSKAGDLIVSPELPSALQKTKAPTFGQPLPKEAGGPFSGLTPPKAGSFATVAQGEIAVTSLFGTLPSQRTSAFPAGGLFPPLPTQSKASSSWTSLFPSPSTANLHTVQSTLTTTTGLFSFGNPQVADTIPRPKSAEPATNSQKKSPSTAPFAKYVTADGSSPFPKPNAADSRSKSASPEASTFSSPKWPFQSATPPYKPNKMEGGFSFAVPMEPSNSSLALPQTASISKATSKPPQISFVTGTGLVFAPDTKNVGPTITQYEQEAANPSQRNAFQNISTLPAFRRWSPEELRCVDYAAAGADDSAQGGAESAANSPSRGVAREVNSDGTTDSSDPSPASLSSKSLPVRSVAEEDAVSTAEATSGFEKKIPWGKGSKVINVRLPKGE
jgi:hypothetical protein